MEKNVDRKKLLDLMTDPTNRYYRYKVCYLILPLFRNSNITPNQVTAFHSVLSLVAAFFVSLGSYRGLIAALVLYEIRMILDCFDGVLAREKKLFSEYGRTVDALGDLVSFLGLLAGSIVYLFRTEGSDYPAVLTTLIMGLGVFSMAGVYDFYKRKFADPLKSGHDDIVKRFLEDRKMIKEKKATIMTRLEYITDFIEISVLTPASMKRLRQNNFEMDSEGACSDAEHIIENAGSRSFMILARVLGLVAGDNALFIINVGLLLNMYKEAQLWVAVYSMVVVVFSLILANTFLARNKTGKA